MVNVEYIKSCEFNFDNGSKPVTCHYALVTDDYKGSIPRIVKCTLSVKDVGAFSVERFSDLRYDAYKRLVY